MQEIPEDDAGGNELHRAARKGLPMAFRIYLQDSRFDPNSPDRYGKTPLHVAIQFGNKSVVEQLLKSRRVNVNSADRFMQTPLHEAVSANEVSIVKLLWKDERVDRNPRSVWGKTPLHLAIEKNHLSILEFFLGENSIDLHCVDDNNFNCIHMACFADKIAPSPDLLRALLKDNRAPPDRTSNSQATPLHFAASSGLIDHVKLLVEDGRAKLLAVDNDLRTPLMKAALSPDSSVVEYLLDATCSKNKATFEAWDIGVNMKDNREETALHIACMSGRVDAAKALLKDPRVNPNLRNVNQMTAMGLAKQRGDELGVKIVNVLRDWHISEIGALNCCKRMQCVASTTAHVQLWDFVIEYLGECKGLTELTTAQAARVILGHEHFKDLREM